MCVCVCGKSHLHAYGKWSEQDFFVCGLFSGIVFFSNECFWSNEDEFMTVFDWCWLLVIYFVYFKKSGLKQYIGNYMMWTYNDKPNRKHVVLFISDVKKIKIDYLSTK